MYDKVLTFNTKEEFDTACMILGQHEAKYNEEYPITAFCEVEAEWRITGSGCLDEDLQFMFDNVLSENEKNTAISYYKDSLNEEDIFDYSYMDDLMDKDVQAVVDEWYKDFEKRVVAVRTTDRFEDKGKLVKELVNYINSFDDGNFREKLVETVNELEVGHIATDKEKIPGYLELRICSVCEKVMAEGYCIEDGESYYCSDECMLTEMTREEFEELYAEGEGDSYHTEWY